MDKLIKKALVLLIIPCFFVSCREKILPVVTTSGIEILSDTSAYGGGTVTDEGSDPVTSRGLCWSTDQVPSISDNFQTSLAGAGDFRCYITGISTNTTYYVSAFATNDAGTAYGDIHSLTLWMGEPGPDVTDADGNEYSSVRIGTQTWMAENLKTTKYNDGTSISLVTDGDEWKDLTTEAYCWYNNDESSYRETYGALYNWYAVNTGKLCPSGWHVPADAEWTTLTDYLESETYAGGKLKETGAVRWGAPNTGATNESGFTALPGGDRGPDGLFYGLGLGAYWWTSSVAAYNVEIDAYYRFTYYNSDDVERLLFHKSMGQSVRCIKN